MLVAVLAVILVSALIMDSGANVADGSVRTLTGPAEKALTWVVRQLEHVYGYMFKYDQLVEENERLYRSIAELEPETRRVLLMRLKGDLSFREIGELLDRSENWARVTFFRGKQKLIHTLGSGEGGKGNG